MNKAEQNSEKLSYWDQYYKNDPDIVNVDLAKYKLRQVKDLLLTGKKITTSFKLSGAKILDIGGGTGKISRFYDLEKNDNDIYIIDISHDMIKVASDLGYNAQVSDVENDPLPHASGYFDFVLIQEVVEHLRDIKFLLSEIKRVLKPGGKVLITTPNLASLADRIYLLFGKRPFCMALDPSHINMYTFSRLQREIAEAGLTIKESFTQGTYVPLPKQKFIKIPTFNKKLGQHVVVLAEKHELNN